MDAILDGSPHPTYSAATESASHQHGADEPLASLSDTGREHRPGAFPHSTPADVGSPPAKDPPAKKSHARKQPEGHIPRPRNAFIIFRCDFVAQKKIPASVEPDHRNISRIVGRIWKAMSVEDRRPWIEAAKREREKHKRLYPQYRYAPSSAGAGAAPPSVLKEKRAQNQKIREKMGVLPAWEVTSHSWSAVQLSMLQPTPEPPPRQAPTTGMQPETHVSVSNALRSTPSALDCGGSVTSHPHPAGQPFAPTVSCEPPSQPQQDWPLASGTEPQQCPPHGHNPSSPPQGMVPFDVTTASPHYDSPDPSPIKLETLPPFMYVATHCAIHNPEFDVFHFSPPLGEVSTLSLPSANAGVYGNDPAPRCRPYPHDLKMNTEVIEWTIDQIDDFIRGMQNESSLNYASPQPNAFMNF